MIKSVMFKEFLRNPRITGAILPSSRHLSNAMTAGIGIKTARRIVELGPGTGAITRHIIRKITPETKFLAVELNPQICEEFSKRFNDIKIINDSAANLRSILANEGLHEADIIISGLPWASFGAELQNCLLTEIIHSLAPRGVFTTFAYIQGLALPTAHIFRRNLDRRFTTVHRTPIIWRNIPPAVVYRCHK
ncbi:MAG: NAD-binding protein [Victivallales bacterium]|nr:NAD-binding protein [Victivallales bacterium]